MADIWGNLDKLKNLWHGGLPALAEILLLACAFYVLLKFLRGTRGAGVLRGILVVFGLTAMVVFVLARILNLEHVTWLVERMVGPLVLAAVIVFQPELRRGLLRLGLHPVFTRFVGARSPVLDELIEAVTALSRRKVGALVAVQRQVSLAEYAERGTKLNAEVSSELLQTIFQPGAPLHDGAVIVQGNRLAAAQCLFPLSENIELSKLLGTRHRAAVGVTEENDSVTVAVSEETGRLSLGVDGKLLQGLSPAELRKKLTDLCLESVEAPNAQAEDA